MLLLRPYRTKVKQYGYILFLAFILFPAVSLSQLPSGSMLPIVVINTDGNATIVDNPRVLATMKIIYRGEGQRTYLTDQSNPAYLNYNGRINIELRGSSSQATEKKQYGFSTLMAGNVTENNVSLMGMPSENDWVFNGMTWDTAKVRDFITYTLSRNIGEYATRTSYCEIIINGDYRGLYLLQEKIKPDKNRVNVLRITPADIYQPEVTGGYITKADKDTGGDPVAWWMTQPNGWGVAYIHDLPTPDMVTSEQNTYIYNQFNFLATTSYNHDMAVATGIPSVIDIPSFIDHMLITELSSNADGYQYSTFFHKDRNGKLRAGPLWDNDLTYGNDLFLWGYDRSKSNIWQFHNMENDGSRFWWDLFSTPLFKCYMSKRWNELIPSEKPLNLTVIDNLIDHTSASISEAVGREYNRWGIRNNFSYEISRMKTWLASRITWMTSNLGSYSGCSNVYKPGLVITKINYHPLATIQYPNPDDLEFIEILNNGTSIADLTGIYFSGTGLVFQFPPNSSLAPDSALFLAGNTDVFREKYGFDAFGKFTRDLSNKSQNIVLADGYGNIIDQVHYYDSIPWPDADGNGKYLTLKSPDLDNNIASSWAASDNEKIRESVLPAPDKVNIYPVPADDYIKIASPEIIQRLEVFDMQGRMVISQNISSYYYELNISKFPKGGYVVRLISKKQVINKGIIKR